MRLMRDHVRAITPDARFYDSGSHHLLQRLGKFNQSAREKILKGGYRITCVLRTPAENLGLLREDGGIRWSNMNSKGKSHSDEKNIV